MEELKALTGSLIAEMRRNTEEVVGLRDEQKRVLEEHVALRRANRREKRWRRISVLIVLIALGSGFLILHHGNAQTRRLGNQQAADLQCIAVHENAQDNRSTVLVKASTARSAALRAMSNAQHTALAYALTVNPDAATLRYLIQVWNDKTDAFNHADDAYNRANKANPVPQLVFSCSDRLAHPAKATPTTVTMTTTAVRPGPTTTRVVPSPTTVPVQGPTQTVVIREPGRTTVRTVTTTKAPPNCVNHPGVLPCTITIPKR